MFCLRKSIILSGSVLISACMALFAGDVSSNTVEAARIVAAGVVNSASETSAMRDMAVIALRNAIAAENDAGESFLVAVKSGDKARQIIAMKKLDDVARLAEESMDMLKKIADYAGEIAAAAGLAKQYEKELASAVTEKDAASKLKQLQKLSALVLKTTKKVQPLAEILKKQWLLPVVSQSTSPVSPVDEFKLQPSISR